MRGEKTTAVEREPVHISSPADRLAPEPIDLAYEADLLGNIQQALAGLQGFDVMALELIQNADDAGAQTIIFDIRDDALILRNDAQFTCCGLSTLRCPWETDGGPDGLSRPCNFHAISRVGSRSKVYVSGQIGRFGIGFVSVYQITDAPIVRSAGIEMRLEPLRGTAPTKTVDDRGGTELELPYASTSSPTRKALNASPAPGAVAQLLRDAIGRAMVQGLFFLKRLKSIEVRRNGEFEQSAAIARDGGLVTLEITPDARVERWKLLTRDAGDLAAERDIFSRYPTLVELKRSPVVHVAIPLSIDSTEGLLYAYLPTEQASRMPLHINGDFFPQPNRRSIVLTGEQHERYWNELLLDTAARAIGEAFTELRDALGGVRLWRLGNAAFELRDTKGFSQFWKAFSEAAQVIPSVITVGNEWRKPSDCHLPPEQMTAAEHTAVANIGVYLQHSDLRPMSTVLSAVGVTQLRLAAIVGAVSARVERSDTTLDDPHLRPLWSAINRMIDADRSRSGFGAALKRLKATRFLIDADGDPASVDELYRPPTGMGVEGVRKYVASCPLVHSEVAQYPAIWDTFDVYGFDDLAQHLADAITDETIAKTVIGEDSQSAQRFYDFLTAFQVEPDRSSARKILAQVPILRTAQGFVSPSRGQLPGGFVDPIGHFELVDIEPLSERTREFVTRVLGVRVLTFKNYIDDHLEDILAGQPTRDQYTSLIREIVEHQLELDSDGGLQPLAEKEFVRTRAGDYAAPSDCYRWSAALETLLGGGGGHWIDEEWMPAGRAGSRCLDLLGRLGMRATPSTQHLVARIAKIAESEPIDEIAKKTSPIVRHIVERFGRLDSHERKYLEGLKSLAFLPGTFRGERVTDKRYPPSLVYRAGRAAGFSSQVTIVDLPPLRGGAGSGASLIDFLDLLKMPPEPPTEKVVAHLEFCMAANSPASDLTYAILNERLSAADASCIDRLINTDCIYDGALKRYLSPDKVFWDPPPLGGHWHAASARMRQHEALFRRLGVADNPEASNYAVLMREIASIAQPSEEDTLVHARCLDWLADALDRGLSGAEEAVRCLEGEFALLNRFGTPVWTEEAAWVDSPSLAEPFRGTQDERLVEPPTTHRSAATRLFRHMGVRPLSEIARFSVATTPIQRPAVAATIRLRERSDLLIWLAPTAKFRDELSKSLTKVQVCCTSNLLVQAEIIEFDPPVRSPANPAPAFFDPETGTLHVRGLEEEPVDWPAAFRALFAQFESHSHGIDMRPLVGTAALVMVLPTWGDAEQALRNSDYLPPISVSTDLPVGTALGDAFEPEPHETSDLSGAEDETSGYDSEGEDLGDRAQHAESSCERSSSGRIEGADSTRPHTSGTGPTGTVDDNPFKSKIDKGAFGAAAKEKGASIAVPRDGVGERASGGQRGGEPATSGDHTLKDTIADRRTRRSRMLTYVAAASDPAKGTAQVGDDNDISDLVDEAAVAAAMKYEQSRGWLPEEQPHTNPGYDIISRTKDGPSRRLIEVKGLEGEWTERGVKLSHVQYGMAEGHPEEFWIYVVEHARDLQRQRVSAIGNPFSKVEEYWFDGGWRQVSEEGAHAEDINIRVGTHVKHDTWGKGTIIAVQRRGIATYVTIDFGLIEGKRYIPYSSSLKFLD